MKRSGSKINVVAWIGNQLCVLQFDKSSEKAKAGEVVKFKVLHALNLKRDNTYFA